METTIYLGRQELRISATLGALMNYKRQFNEEYLDKFIEIEKIENVEKAAAEVTITGFRLIWAMARAAGEPLPSPDKWVAGLGEVKNLLPALINANGLFKASIKNHEKKNDEETPADRKITTEEFLAAALRAGIDYEAAKSMTIGELNSIFGAMIERDEENKSNVRLATQADFDRFKGL